MESNIFVKTSGRKNVLFLILMLRGFASGINLPVILSILNIFPPVVSNILFRRGIRKNNFFRRILVGGFRKKIDSSTLLMLYYGVIFFQNLEKQMYHALDNIVLGLHINFQIIPMKTTRKKRNRKFLNSA